MTNYEDTDSDDTDILLLIPPNFFSTKAESDAEKFKQNNDTGHLNSHVVKGIINHIHDLEDRLSTIETIDSARSSCYSDSEMNNRCNSGYRNVLNSPCTGGGGSLNRTPVKYRASSTCHSTPSYATSPRVQRDIAQQRDHLSKSYSPLRSGSKAPQGGSKVMQEGGKVSRETLVNDIDGDFYDRDRMNRHNESDNLGTSLDMDISNTNEGTLSNLSTSPPPKESNYGSINKLDLPTIERMLKQVEATQKEFEDKLKQKEEDFNVKKVYNCGSNVGSVPDLNFGLRNLQYDQQSQQTESPEHLVSRKTVAPLESAEPRAKRKLDLGAPGGEPAPSVEMQKLYNSNYQQDLPHEAPSIPTKLLSLSELWKQDRGSESPSKSVNSNVLRRKIEEEKYRREHCEQLIQQLQFRLLEETEKNAVALKVDAEKDRAIRTLQAGWAQLVGHWREIEAQRHELTNKLISEKQERQNEVNELTKKLERYEREVSQVVNLAAGYKEKAESAEATKSSVQCEAAAAVESMRASLATMERALAETKVKLDDYQKDRKMLADKLALTEEELDKLLEDTSNIPLPLNYMFEKLLTKDVQAQLEELKITLRISKEKIESLEKALEVESKKNGKLEEELQDARNTCEEVVKKEQKARDELELLSAKSNSIKTELREFYQNQLNSNVKEKLKEFQSQLDSAELSLHREFQAKEKTIAENAAKQLKQISEKLIFDFKAKCEVYEAENKKLKSDLTQREAKIKEINAQLREESKKRELMARKVETVMQSQLQQAIHMITADVAHLHTSKESLASRQASEQSVIDSTTNETNLPANYASSTNLNMPGDNPQDSVGSNQYAPSYATGSGVQYTGFGADNVVEKDVPNNGADEMRKYIQMLLEKPPGNPVSDLETEQRDIGGGITSFLESSVTSDIFNENPPYSGISRTARSKSNQDNPVSQPKGNCRKIWK